MSSESAACPLPDGSLCGTCPDCQADAINDAQWPDGGGPVVIPERAAAYTCSLCGFTAGRFRSWVHTHMEWAWWRPFDKRPYHVRNRCVRWLP